MTVSELDVRMSSREFMEWMVYAQIEPFGPAREDYRSALISTVIANSTGNKMKPDDFIRPFSFEGDDEEVEEGKFDSKQEAMMSIFKAMSKAKPDEDKQVRSNRSQGIEQAVS